MPSVQSLTRALDLLDHLADAGGRATLSELAAASGLPAASVHRLLATLVAQGHVRREAGRRYALGPRLVRLGDVAGHVLGEGVGPVLRELVATTGESANLAGLDGDAAVYLAQAASPHPMRMFTEIGRRVPLHATGVGKALLAAMSPGDVEAALARTGMPARTPATLTDPVPPARRARRRPHARLGARRGRAGGRRALRGRARARRAHAVRGVGVRPGGALRARRGRRGRPGGRGRGRAPGRGPGRTARRGAAMSAPETPPDTLPDVAVCWDVDGTLLRGGVVGREVLEQAFTTVTGHPAPEEQVLMPGRTDWLIGEALRDALPDEHATTLRGRGDAFGHDMIAEVGAEWGRREPDLAAVAHTLPGIPETIAALAAEPGVVQTLTTGNVRAGARAKLAAVGLTDGPIDLALGGYGEGPGERVRVVTAARDALAARYGSSPTLVVVGDTPLDVEAAHRAGAIAVGVATGGATLEELHASGAEHVFADLADPGRLVAVVRSAREDRHAASRGGG